MGKLLELRQRIRAVEQIQTITRTLATVAAAKLSRTRRRAAGLRAYAGSIRGILSRQQHHIACQGLDLGAMSGLLGETRPVRTIALLVVTGDRGMCGGYNLEACRFALEFWNASRKAGKQVRFVLKGRKGSEYFAKRRAEILHREAWGRAGHSASEVERLLELLLRLYFSGEADAIYAVYTEFHSPIRRRPRAVRLVPVPLPEPAPEEEPGKGARKWYYEPNFAELMDELVAVYLRVQLHHVLLASYASEQGARMMTMEEATERADKALQDYRVRHNRLRREAITTDLLGALFASRAAEAAASPPTRHA